jgi:hypothetical protein
LRPLLCATAVMIICLGTAAWAASDKDVTVSRFVWVMLF